MSVLEIVVLLNQDGDFVADLLHSGSPATWSAPKVASTARPAGPSTNAAPRLGTPLKRARREQLRGCRSRLEWVLNTQADFSLDDMNDPWD